jgi:hypothetical protein
MNYYDITNEISRLIGETHEWSSTILQPDGDKCIDISSAAMQWVRHQLLRPMPPSSLTYIRKGGLHLCIALIRTFMMMLILGCNLSLHLLKLVVLVNVDWFCITRIRDKLSIGKHVTNCGAVTDRYSKTMGLPTI